MQYHKIVWYSTILKLSGYSLLFYNCNTLSERSNNGTVTFILLKIQYQNGEKMPKKNFHVITIRKSTFEKLVEIRRKLIEKRILEPNASYSDVIDEIADRYKDMIEDIEGLLQ